MGRPTEQDTEVVRANFRHMVWIGCWLLAALSVVHAVTFVFVGQSMWRASAAMAVLAGVLTQFVHGGRSFPVFLTALFVGLFAVLAYAATLTLGFGRAAGFHFLLLALLPLVAVSGRVGPRVKATVALLLGGYLIGLDQMSIGVAESLSPELTEGFRVLSGLVLVVALTGLTYHYFSLVARQQSMLEAQASTDALTGLVNRRGLVAAGEALAARCRGSRQPLSLVLCDLDHFKQINDRHGHDAGDLVLKRAADVLQRGVRAGDVVGRWGGEEFLLLLPGADAAGAFTLAECVRLSLGACPLDVNGLRLNVTITMGVVTLRADESFDDGLVRADRSLYRGKAAGRNRVLTEGLATS